MRGKLVSVITPCYNSAKYITALFDSIIAQEYKPIELIVIDDGSTDDITDVYKDYEKKFEQSQVQCKLITKNKNEGASSAINLGLKEFNGEYVTFIDADDYLNKSSISKRVEVLEKNDKLDAVYSDVSVVDAEDYDTTIDVLRSSHAVNGTDLFEDMLLENDYIWPPVAYLVRTRSLQSVNPEMKIQESSVGQNIQLFLPLWYRRRVGYLAEQLVTVTVHEDSHSRIYRGEGEYERQKKIEALYIDTLNKIGIPMQKLEEYRTVIRKKYQLANKKVFYDVIDGRDDLSILYDRDQERFRKSFFTGPDKANQSQLASRLVFSSHSLEKSLSNDGFEIGHGFMVVRILIGLLDVYAGRDYDRDHLAYTNTLSVLGSFYDKHKRTKYQEEIEKMFGDWLPLIKSCNSEIGGATQIPVSEKRNNDVKNFKQLAEGRFAVRAYSDESVSKTDILEALEIALKTPTVCNRQPVRVRVMYDKEIIAKVLAIQGGIAHYETPPVLLLITADDNSYVGVNERNQGYIDGGLFAMSVLYALEFKELAACPLHAMFETERDFKVRGMLNIPDNEKLITFISAGHFAEASNVCKSFRYPLDFILKEVNGLHDYRIETVFPEQAADVVQGTGEDDSYIGRVKRTVRVRTRMRQATARIGAYLDRREYDKADGAILTLTGYFNYGNVMQRYALQKFLKDHGLNFVSYADSHSSPRDMYKVGRKKKFKTPLRMILRFTRGQKPYWYVPDVSEIFPEAGRMKNIIKFVNTNVWVKSFDPNDNYKSYIVGSDQVWRNWWDNSEKLGYYFLNFLEDRKVNRIAYAASFGKDKIDEAMSAEDVDFVDPNVSLFDHISVREKSGIKLLKDTWGIDDAVAVVDPTLLLDASDYTDLIEKTDVSLAKIQPIFTYVLGETDETRSFVRSIQNHRKQPVTVIRAHEGSEDDVLPPVELWLKGFRDAELVITNSFHGMLFSVINNTDFIIIGREVGGLSRIEDFLHMVGLEERFVHEAGLKKFEVSKLKHINWDKVNSKLAKAKKESSDWLLSAIDNRDSV